VLEHEEAAVDHAAVTARLFDEAADLAAIADVDGAKARRRVGGGERVSLAMVAMEAKCGGDVDVADTVAVGEAEVVFVARVLGHALEASAGHGDFAGVHQRHVPGFGAFLVHGHAVGMHAEGDIGHVQEVVGEVLLDQIALVAAADDEVIDSVG